jgi:alkaline phosphatase D
MDQRHVQVDWEVAEDDKLTKVVARGTEVASPQLAHTVHAEVQGLKPDRWYWYRFRAGDAESVIGRTRTMPTEESASNHVRFAVTSCQIYEQGLFTAYEQMARDNVDLVFHLGDYIYEYEAGRNGKVRTHIGKEIESLDDYRVRYSQYRADPLLSQMHAQCPWLVTWDDHEFDNNCAGDISEEKTVDPVDFLARRANAYQAYYEMMPLRRAQLPRGSSLLLYRQVSFGKLANFMILDTRQYRTDQPNDDKRSPLNDAALAKTNSLLGREQRDWLSGELIASQAIWNVLAQQVMMGMVGFPRENEPLQYSMDQWPGCAYERMQLVKYLAERRISNPVVLTGDIHSNWVNELRVDDRRVEDPVVATEFVATSLSSGGNGVDKPKGLDGIMAENACVKFHNAQRGYILCDVTDKQWRSDYKVMDDVLKPGGTCSIRKSFAVESGDPRAKEV